VTVYVDAAIHRWRGKLWCHLASPSMDELHAFARRLGLGPAGFQRPPAASWPHYDLTSRRRAEAVRQGAAEADRRTIVLVAAEAMAAWAAANRPDLLPAAEEKLRRLRG
jgi:hypothetical protein